MPTIKTLKDQLTARKSVESSSNKELVTPPASKPTKTTVKDVNPVPPPDKTADDPHNQRALRALTSSLDDAAARTFETKMAIAPLIAPLASMAAQTAATTGGGMLMNKMMTPKNPGAQGPSAKPTNLNKKMV